MFMFAELGYTRVLLDEWVDRANPPMRACLGVDLEPPHLVEIVVTAKSR